jgi:ferredoxin
MTRQLPSTGRRPEVLLHVNWVACDGRGLCTELVPELLERDDWGYPHALGYGSDIPVAADLEAAARDAVALCPRLALSLDRRAVRRAG